MFVKLSPLQYGCPIVNIQMFQGKMNGGKSKIKSSYPFPEVSTMERLIGKLWSDEGLVCRYGDFVLATAYHWDGGYPAAIYRFEESPETSGRGEGECLLRLCETSVEAFTDAGHALAWAIEGAERKED